MKRVFDFSIAVILLVLLSPLFIVLVLIGSLKFKGRPFFTQCRAGRGGESFQLIKFKSMTDEIGVDGSRLPDQQRLTPYGCWIRSLSLDELPELWNILMGQMSFVGPRPLPIEYLERYSTYSKRRLEVRPGLTGLAQVKGRNHLGWSRRFRYDVWYVDHQNFFLDLKILWMTLWVVLKREGISAHGEATMSEYTGDKLT